MLTQCDVYGISKGAPFQRLRPFLLYWEKGFQPLLPHPSFLSGHLNDFQRQGGERDAQHRDHKN